MFLHAEESTKTIYKYFIILVLLVLLFNGVPPKPASAAGVLYASPAASGAGNCSSWANACALQTALAAAVSGTEIWVAAGTYKPTSGTDRTVSFVLKDGVALYGGFAGTETTRAARDPLANPTILSGDLNGDDNGNVQSSEPTRADNSYHVVTGSGTTSSAILDGFTITAGNANGTNPYERGGGMYNLSGSPTITNDIFSNNSVLQMGGGMYNSASNPSLTNVTFSNNSSTNHGGGIYNYNGSTTSLTGVTFSGNSALLRGGGLYNYSSNSTLLNVTFTGNSAQDLGGGMDNYLSDSTLTNVTFTNNTSATSGGGMYSEGGNINLNGVSFTGNSADDGGGMLNSSQSNGSLVNVTFTE